MIKYWAHSKILTNRPYETISICNKLHPYRNGGIYMASNRSTIKAPILKFSFSFIDHLTSLRYIIVYWIEYFNFFKLHTLACYIKSTNYQPSMISLFSAQQSSLFGDYLKVCSIFDCWSVNTRLWFSSIQSTQCFIKLLSTIKCYRAIMTITLLGF